MAQTANEKFFDALVRHQVGLMRLEPGIARQVNDLLNATESAMVGEIVRRVGNSRSPLRVEQLLKAIRAIRNPAWVEAAQVWADSLDEISKDEAAFVWRAMVAASPSVIDPVLPTAGRLAQIAKSTPFEGRIMSDWANRQAAGDIARIEQAIKTGLTQGQSSLEIARRVVGSAATNGTDGVTQISRNNAKTITRTAINAIANQARRDVFEENADLIEGELYVATLDSRTTLVCAGNDGKTFPVGEGPIPPLHWNCRSLRVATLDGDVIGDRPSRDFTEQQLLREFSAQEGFRKPGSRKTLPHGTRGQFDAFSRRRKRELTGPVPARTTYQQWLTGQSAQFQDDVLGPTRGRLFRSGRVKLDRFTNKQGERLTIKELRQME